MSNAISIIIPTYNEKDTIVPLVKRLHHALATCNYEIIIVDDNSRDGTIEAAESLSSQYPVTVFVRRDKKGLASAVVDGIEHAGRNIIGVMDADLQHPPEIVPLLEKAVGEGADIAIASRYIKGGGCSGWTLPRKILSRGAVFLAHLFLPATRKISDPMSGFFMFRKQVVAGAILKPEGYKILLEILMMGKSRNIIEVPYTFETRSAGESKLSFLQQLYYLKHIFSLAKRKGELIRFGKFCLVGASGVIVNEGLLLVLKQYADLPLALASMISVETSIISNFLLNNYFTFADRRSPGTGSLAKRLGMFNLVSLAGLAINIGTLLLLTLVPGIHYLVSNLCGIALAFIWNYLINSRYTWQ